MSGFLCSMVGASFTVTAVALVGRTQKTITTNGNAQVSTAQSKFGGASALFDGTGDYLQIDDFGTVAGSTQNFTIEFWVRWNSLTGGQGLVSDRPPTSESYGSTNFYLEKNSSNTIYFGYSGGGDITGTSSVAANTWYHMAIVRSSGTTKFYLNGTTSGSTLSYTGAVGDGTLSIGAVVGQYMNGYIDELRISNSARYTANFTPSTTAFVNDANTLLLIHADGTNASTVFTDDASVIITPAASSVNEGSSLTFNVTTAGATDQTLYYTLSNAGDFATSSGSFSLTSNAGSFSVTPTADTTTEGAETFTASVRTESTSGPIIATSSAVTINDTSVAPIVVNSAFTDDSSTKILLHFENNGVDDNSSGRTAVATQSIFDSGAFRTDQKKFGSYSVGSTGIPGGWSTNNPTALNPGTGDFTIEFWFRPCATANSDLIAMGSQSNGSVHLVVSADNGFLGFGKQNISWDVQATVGAISVAWHHFAVTRSGTTLRLYLDGTVRDTVTGNTDNYTSNVWAFNMGGLSPTYFHMDEFRISSIARYTSNFTVA